MLYVYAVRFDVTRNLKKNWYFLETKRGLIIHLPFLDGPEKFNNFFRKKISQRI